MTRLVFVAGGALFGFLLSRARATEYDAILGMFRFQDFHLFGVIGVAIAVAAAGFYLLRRAGARSMAGRPIEFHRKPTHRWIFAAGLLFGTGWALTGACPGPALTQLGEGKLYAAATVAGILGGTYLYAWIQGGRASSSLKA
jgi:uncharacterized membrane protein YedE/YeeE